MPGLHCSMWDLLVVACGLLSCGMWTLSCGMHVGSSSPTRGGTRPPCIGSVESYPLDHQGSPRSFFLKQSTLWLLIFHRFFSLEMLKKIYHVLNYIINITADYKLVHTEFFTTVRLSAGLIARNGIARSKSKIHD